MRPSSAAPDPSWPVGDVIVHRVDEVVLPPATGPWLLPDATPEVVAGQDWLRPHFADPEGILRLDSHSFVFVVDGQRVLVDTGIGNGKERANPAWHNLQTDFLERLTAGGFSPDSVDLVVLTRLHADHVGWNTREVNGSWVSAFPNARYLTSRTEREARRPACGGCGTWFVDERWKAIEAAGWDAPKDAHPQLCDDCKHQAVTRQDQAAFGQKAGGWRSFPHLTAAGFPPTAGAGPGDPGQARVVGGGRGAGTHG
ncbi:MBL fold metallo-hydrolase [Streptomyces sp. NPDC050433]|uniref:MBL fold metallo-hydrolase n=1 Tax=unclassified Streptomyces TaxID=2593676 RepID=UPI003440DB6B